MGSLVPWRATLAGAALALAAMQAASTGSGQAFAQSYPARPIRVLLPFAGGTDAVARLLAPRMSPALGQQLVPEPRLGARLNAEAVAAMNSPDIRARLAELGGDPASGTPEQAAEFLRREYEQWGRVIREAGIKAE
jgi:tripartite-type tricarboxylate transporter receptor subunit TctC